MGVSAAGGDVTGDGSDGVSRVGSETRTLSGRKRRDNDGGGVRESTVDHETTRKRQRSVTAKREPDTARRRGLRKRDATGVVTSEDSDTETQHAHKRGRHEQVSKVVWSERDPWRDK